MGTVERKQDSSRTPEPEVAVLKKTALILFTPLFLACVLGAQQAQPPAPSPAQPPAKAPAEYKIPPEDASRVNPVKPTPESLAKARKMYGMDCAMCHGDYGDGKGDLAADMKNVTDFTKPDAMKDRTDGELFYIIRKGKGDMPLEGERAKNDDVWSLVNYVRAFAKKKE
jgi:mono/diheme cytochrome c family protein